MYLESSSLVNNRYYARYGFEVQRDIFLERGKTPVRRKHWSSFLFFFCFLSFFGWVFRTINGEDVLTRTVSIMVREPGAGRKSTPCKTAGAHPGHGIGARQLLGMGKRGLGLARVHVEGGLNAKIG